MKYSQLKTKFFLEGQKSDLPKIGIFGMGYVGLPLAYYFSKSFEVIGYDTNLDRVNRLVNGIDDNNELDSKSLKAALMGNLQITSDLFDLKDVDIYIVTVPTPVNESNQPDLQPLIKASEAVAKVITKGNFVIYESTVYPGATEEDCIPVIESGSGLIANKDFFFGYSPERINPGDKTNKLPNIVKVVSGSSPEVLLVIAELYEKIIEVGVHRASSIKVAEAAKIIENTQRDVNIALINEFSILFEKLKIPTFDVLNAAATKWNFIRLQPGLVGGHCIGVDPYYLIHKARAVGHVPDIIVSGREINANMPSYVAQQVIYGAIRKKIDVPRSKCLVLGYSFKENCPDIRNSGSVTLVQELSNYVGNIDVYDPVASGQYLGGAANAREIYDPHNEDYDIIVLCVAHNQFTKPVLEKITNRLSEPNRFFYSLKPVPGVLIDQTL